MKETNKLLENKVKERTAELNEHKEELLANNELLSESLATKDRFFSIIAHDLKNPINSMIGFSDLLLRKWNTTDDEKKHRFIALINESSNHLFALLSNLLDWARSQTGKITVNIEKFPLENVVKETLIFLSPQADDKKISLLYEIDKDTTVLADYNMIETVFRNIISNSIKYTHRNGTIKTIIKNIDNNLVQIIVEDNGVGMSKEKVAELFRVDKNVSTPGTETEKGTGLGLIVCNEFIKLNNGTISVESSVGVGTKFIIHLNK